MVELGERVTGDVDRASRREVNGGGADATERPRAQTPATTKPRKGRRRFYILGAIVLVAAIAGSTWWYLTRYEMSTDDAFIDGNVARLAPRVGGTVARVLIDDNQHVRAGQPLVEIDPVDYKVALKTAEARLEAAKAQASQAQASLDLTGTTAAAQLSQAKAQLAVAQSSLLRAQADTIAGQAEVARTEADARRYKRLNASDYASAQRYDEAVAASRSADAKVRADQALETVARAQIEAAQASLASADTVAQQVAVKAAQLKNAQATVAQNEAAVRSAQLDLGYTTIYAPADGYVTRKQVQPGDVLQANQSVMSFVFGVPWVTANYKETDLTYMRPGQPVDIEVDTYSGVKFKGHVDSIQRGTGAQFALLPPENATGNYVKVVQRVPVKIVFEGGLDLDHTLALGMSVVPTVDVSKRAGAGAD